MYVSAVVDWYGDQWKPSYAINNAQDVIPLSLSNQLLMS